MIQEVHALHHNMWLAEGVGSPLQWLEVVPPVKRSTSNHHVCRFALVSGKSGNQTLPFGVALGSSL